MLDCKNFITNLADIDDEIDIIVERFKIKKIKRINEQKPDLADFLAEHRIKNEISKLLSNISIQTIFMKTENNKKNEPNQFALGLS